MRSLSRTSVESLLRLIALAAAALSLAGCASTRIASAWKDPADRGGTLKKVVVFVAVKDDAVRRFAENQAVRNPPPGTAVVAGHTLFDKPEPDMKRMRARLVQEGFDGALVARLVSVDKTQTYHPPEVQFAPFGPWPVYSPSYHSFYWYYPYAYTYMTPGHTTVTTRVLVETVLYRLPEGKPVWSAASETVNPDSTLDLVDELIDVLTKRLRREGLVTGL